MRTHLKVVTISLVLAAGACAQREEPAAALSDDLKRDLAAASAASGDLVVAPQSYQRMRFVSDVEQPRKVERVRRPSVARRPPRPTVKPRPAPQAEPDVVREPEVVAEAPAPVAEHEQAIPEPVVIAQRPTPDPLPADVIPVSAPSDGGMAERGRRGGIGGMGGIVGGILGGVVLRGGHGGRDKCDPRTDGRNRPPVFDRPTFGMPVPTGRAFPGTPIARSR